MSKRVHTYAHPKPGPLNNETDGKSGDGGRLKVLTIGICAMNKKVSASPMRNILRRLQFQNYINIAHFSDDVILNKPIEEWPLCDCLIAFYSKGFPLDKAIAYVNLRHPFVMNDLEMQYSLMDRRNVFKILSQQGVEVPKYAVLCRESSTNVTPLMETEDSVEVGGVVFHKPFVEKPVSAEDHKVYVYFPSSYGGGSQRLFRKIKDRSSEYFKEGNIRTSGSYMYEEFMPTDGIDIKVYAVGLDYAHAEARKSAALDGRVERDESGKEKRFPVLLTAAEKLIARKVVYAFKQTVCGFDILRSNGKSYVCDVNGFSFVKNSQKYYDDCAQILLEMITAKLAPQLIPQSMPHAAEDVPDAPVFTQRRTGEAGKELRCVIGIIRHGDRTPKQKMKMVVTHVRFIKLFEELNGPKTGHIKIKEPKLLQQVLDICRCLLEEASSHSTPPNPEAEQIIHKLHQLKAVLEMHGYFSGINRKVQLKQLLRQHKGGQVETGAQATQLLLILKWGGELTSVGQRQAEELGRAFRCMYPGGEGEYASLPGSGFLRLHSTYRHDLKVYASDEGRVQMTAAAFTKGLLELEGSLASVLVHLVKRDREASAMLDASSLDTDEVVSVVKERLHGLLRTPTDVTSSMAEKVIPNGSACQKRAMFSVGNFMTAYEKLYQSMKRFVSSMRELAKTAGNEVTLYHEELLDMALNRWEKLETDFKDKNGHFDISKILHIYNWVTYDLLHNRQLGIQDMTDIYMNSMDLADILIPQEYGMTTGEKINIATHICQPLLKKILADIRFVVNDEASDILHHPDCLSLVGVTTPDRHVRTRLYFTSQSHVHAVLNVLRYGGLLKDMQNASLKEALDKLDSTPELNYLTQIMFMMYEDTRQPPDSPARFEVQVLYSPGVQYRERFLSGVGGQGHNPLQSPDQELATARTCNSEVPPAKVPSSPSSPIDCVQAEDEETDWMSDLEVIESLTHLCTVSVDCVFHTLNTLIQAEVKISSH
ncbi:hypothetical protein EMCRGX_G011713 [Ephydatia muelleri]|eukprot:Em0006g716a